MSEAEIETGSRIDDLVADSIVYQCAECIREEREFSCHPVERIAVVNDEVVCLDCVAEFYPKARQRRAPDIAKKLRRQRMHIAKLLEAHSPANKDRAGR